MAHLIQCCHPADIKQRRKGVITHHAQIGNQKVCIY